MSTSQFFFDVDFSPESAEPEEKDQCQKTSVKGTIYLIVNASEGKNGRGVGFVVRDRKMNVLLAGRIKLPGVGAVIHNSELLGIEGGLIKYLNKFDADQISILSDNHPSIDMLQSGRINVSDNTPVCHRICDVTIDGKNVLVVHLPRQYNPLADELAYNSMMDLVQQPTGQQPTTPFQPLEYYNGEELRKKYPIKFTRETSYHTVYRHFGGKAMPVVRPKQQPFNVVLSLHFPIL